MIWTPPQAGYSYDEENRVWIRSDYLGIAYSDGVEVEQRIGEIITNAKDLSILSDELRQHCTDWPSRYHLDGSRANILRPFETELGRGDILEIGAGCGAITRFLAECGGNVLALEGSPRRASIARARTRDLDNVTVICDRFDDFRCDKKFDTITLIGVLEYANLFTEGLEPPLAMLERVRKFLKPDGKLIIAIENQFGLKYFAGAPEDHLGHPMIGIEGRYRANSPQTFGRKALKQLLINAGLSSIKFSAAYPDYKFPVSIVTEEGFSDGDFDAAPLALLSVPHDPQMPAFKNFSMELAYPDLIANGFGIDMANSFLVVASSERPTTIKQDVLAFHYSTGRLRKYCKETLFVRRINSPLQVYYNRLGATSGPEDFSILNFNLPDKDHYVVGKLLLIELMQIVMNDGWSYDQIAGFMRRFLQILCKLGAFPENSWTEISTFTEIPGRFFDAVPHNIVVQSDGSVFFVDCEWQLERPIEIGYLLFRSLLALIGCMTRFGRPDHHTDGLTRQQFIDGVLTKLGLSLQEADYDRYMALEAEIQQAVTGLPIDQSIDWGRQVPLPFQTLSEGFEERVTEVLHLRHVLGERDKSILGLQQTVTDRDFRVKQLEHACGERQEIISHLEELLRRHEDELQEIFSSRSWWLTKPYRWAGRIIRGDISGAVDPFRKLLNIKTDVPSSAELPADVLVPAPIPPTNTVSVILPVYRGVEMTRRCIEAAMPGVLGMKDAVLLAINDGSPEEGMQAMLESQAKIWPGRFEVLKNPVNLGFVGTVNRGIEYFPSQDVVLLNSDVIVPNDWLKRLQAEAYSHPHIATVTPFSNNATICSFPNFLEENPLAFNLDVNTIDGVFRQSHLPCVLAPTGVGFCMFIRRSCLDQIGYLNAEKFGRGYGEENDLCQRAIKAGWHNILSPNIYAYHEGSVSFSTEKLELIERALAVIDSLHPNYHADVQAFIQRDPLRSARSERYLQLLVGLKLPKVLHVSHGLGGGVEQHIKELADYFDQRAAHLVLEPQDGSTIVKLSLRVNTLTDQLEFDMPADYSRLCRLLAQIGISAVHYHHTYNLHPNLLNLSRDLNATTLLTAHDFFWLNSNPTLTDANGRFPGKYVDDLQNPLFPRPNGVTPEQWRDQLRHLIEAADCVIFPSNATRMLFGDLYRFKKDVVTPHVEPYLNVEKLPRQPVIKQHYVIGVLGAVGREKGADLLEKLAVMADSHGARFSFKLIGYAYRELRQVEVTGPYKVENLTALIEQCEVDIIMFPAQWPETYSYTLSHALASGLPIIAPNLGAFPERLSGRASTYLFDHLEPVSSIYSSIGKFIGALEIGPACAQVYHGDQLYLEFYDREYIPLLENNPKTHRRTNFSFDLDGIQISGPTKNVGRRNTILRCLSWLNTRPSLRWISLAIPYRFKCKVKFWLSRSL